MPEMDELCGNVTTIIFRNEQNGFTVLELASDDGSETVAVGCMPLAQPGERLKLTGYWTEHREYGMQFKASSYVALVPATLENIERYLAAGFIKGVGEVTAHMIVEHFGETTLDVLENSPHRLLEINGIGRVRAQQIAESFAAHRSMRDIMLALQAYGITTNQALKLYKLYGDTCVEVLRSDPYRLITDVANIGFKTADKIALGAGFEHDSPQRLGAGLRHVLQLAYGEGHTCLPRTRLLEIAIPLLGASGELVENALDERITDIELVQYVIDDTEFIFLPHAYRLESESAQMLISLAKQRFDPPYLDVEDALARAQLARGIKLAPDQRTAVLSAVGGGLCIITGGPGTGKTTIISFILELMDNLGLDVELCAPTGRAAKRITETTGREARTIHRLLEYGRGSERFLRNEQNPLLADVFILDEASMLDIQLLYAFLKALPAGARLILVGDVDQLPSVGAGNVLKDIIAESGAPVIYLREIFRQAQKSLIVTNAHRINAGNMPVINMPDSDFTFEQITYPSAVLKRVIELCRGGAPFTGLDPLKDLQVLAPMKKGLRGVNNLNKELQNALNPPQPHLSERTVGETLFRVGDKIMQVKNNYQAEWTRPLPGGGMESGRGVFNGDLGTLMAIDPYESTLHVLFDDERSVYYDFSQLDELELAYCISIHKSQGSEFPAVLLPLLNGPPMLMTRNLLYTAVTRARTQVHIIGSAETLRRMAANAHTLRRYSALGYFISEMGGG
jgi:exodeoxyribonuclease V alpha subunit